MSTSTTSRSKPGSVNIHDPGDYPIILGDSLKDVSRSQSKLMQVRYNWEPKNGFQRHRGNLKQNNNSLNLTYQEDDSSSPAYSYDGYLATSKNLKDDTDVSRLVLVFDESKSAFVLERITTSIDMNVASAPNQTKDDIKRHRQLRKPSSGDNVSTVIVNQDVIDDEEEAAADSSNPYDYRHFLAEAKENAEKGIQTGNRTPIPGSGTPTSRIASPSLGAGKFTNGSSLRPIPTSTPVPKRQPIESSSKPNTSTKTTKKPALSKRKETTTLKSSSQKLSADRITNSDDEASDTITINHPPSKGHTRNAPSTSSYSRSPRITVNDGDDLEIDMGTPPPERKRKQLIDLGAFQQRPHTPTSSQSTNTKTNNKKQPPPSSSRPRDTDNDIIMPDADSEASLSDSDDRDVDAFELGSPQPAKKDEAQRQQQSQSQSQQHQQSSTTISVPTPPIPQSDVEEEEDEDLERLLNQALEEEEQEEDGKAVGGGGYGHVQDEDESEVSEEE